MPFGQGRSGGGGGRGRGDKKPGDKEKGQRRTLFRRRKVCKFCADKIDDINYKDVKLIGPFVPERGKILPRRISGTCAMHQRKLQTAIKRSRQIALIPYVTDLLQDRGMVGLQDLQLEIAILPSCRIGILQF
jgi:small subunit ribosomal protein S18